MPPTDEQIYFFSPSVEAFSVLFSGNLPKGKKITLLNTGWMADINPMKRWTTAADWWFHKGCFVDSQWTWSFLLQFVSVKTRMFKSLTGRSAGYFLITWLLSFLDVWHFNLMKPDLTTKGGNSLREESKCSSRYLPIFPRNSQLYLHFSLFVNHAVKNQGIERDGLWKPLNVSRFWWPLKQTACFNQGILQGWYFCSSITLRYRNSGRHIN